MGNFVNGNWCIPIGGTGPSGDLCKICKKLQKHWHMCLNMYFVKFDECLHVLLKFTDFDGFV